MSDKGEQRVFRRTTPRRCTIRTCTHVASAHRTRQCKGISYHAECELCDCAKYADPRTTNNTPPQPVDEEGVPELLPCPFCGSPTMQMRDLDEGVWFLCFRKGCNVEVLSDYETVTEAIAHWNQRATQPATGPSDPVAESARRADEAIATLKQIRDLAASSRSYVPQENAAEMMLRLEELGFGAQEPRRGNTLWAMVMDAADEIQQRRATPTDIAEIARRAVERLVNRLPDEIAVNINKQAVADIITAEFGGREE